jgi:microcystin-dependent protein
MALIELGLIDGNYWNAAHVDRIEAAINQCAPAGQIVQTIAVAAPTGWLMLAGQVVPNAQTLYPDLWLVVPATWKSGASLVLPNASDRVAIGQSGTKAIGTVGGANARALAAANLPAHAHTIDHGHGAGSGSTGDAVDRLHGGSGAHNHQTMVGLPANVKLISSGDPFPGTSPAGINATGSGYMLLPPTSTGPGGQDHQHDFSVTVAPLAGGVSGNGPGTAAALDTTPAFLAINYVIKAH